jgi:hypothetical protein
MPYGRNGARWPNRIRKHGLGMAIRNDSRIGRTRLKLARMLTERFPELEIVDPFLLQPQIPIYASAQFDCCKWDANLPLKARGSYHVYSWSTMGDLVRHGFDFTKEGYEIELS